jgi:hypothetical protein
MTASTRFQLVAVAALLAAAPVAASADLLAYGVAPVAIQSVENHDTFVSLPYGPQTLYTNALTVGFTNTTNVAANNVEFAVTTDGKTTLVAERGSYAPGTRIDRQLAFSTGILPGADATVAVAKVDFADGSSWTPEAGRIAQR